jgi:hypothetical protein
MSEPRRIFVGVIPSGQDVTYVGEGAVDPVAFLINEAAAELDRQRAAEARALAAKAADIERARRTKLARTRRRIRKALSWLR